MTRVIASILLALGLVLVSSVVLNDCGDEVADGKKEGDTIVSRLADLDRYRSCEHVETIHHGGSEWEWVWACEDEPRLVPEGSWEPLAPEAIARSPWLRAAARVEPWHELVLGLALSLAGLVLLVRSFPPSPTDPSSPT